MRIIAAAFVLFGLCLQPLSAEMSTDDRAAFRAEVRAYLLENPEVLMEAMEILQAREEMQAADMEQKVLTDHADAFYAAPGDWIGGNPAGDVTVIEFLDYRCGYCRKANLAVEELIASDGNIKFILKEFPILGEDSLISARFAIAARLLHGDAAYKQAHDAMITLKAPPTADNLAQVAADLGLDPEPILTLMPSDKVTDLIKTNHATADLLEITGTPTFIIGRQVIRGYLPLESLQEIVAEEREKG